MLVEIERSENNVDLKGLECKKIFECFVKYENKLLVLSYILIVFDIVNSQI